MRKGVWPKVHVDETLQFWRHLSDRDCPYNSSSKTHAPLWIWGDDAVYNEQNEKLTLICFGHVLDNRTNSLEVCYPLCVFREESWKHVQGPAPELSKIPFQQETYF